VRVRLITSAVGRGRVVDAQVATACAMTGRYTIGRSVVYACRAEFAGGRASQSVQTVAAAGDADAVVLSYMSCYDTSIVTCCISASCCDYN